MTITPHKVEVAAGEPPALPRSMFEEQLAAHTNRLTELTMYRRLPGGGYDRTCSTSSPPRPGRRSLTQHRRGNECPKALTACAGIATT